MNNITFKANDQHKNTITINDGIINMTLKANENGDDVLINGKSIEDVKELKVALNIIVKALNLIVVGR